MRYTGSQGSLLLFTIRLKMMVSMAAGNVRVFSKGATGFTKSHSARGGLSSSLMIGQTGECEECCRCVYPTMFKKIHRRTSLSSLQLRFLPGHLPIGL